MTRPLIGISTYRQAASWGVWTQSADLLPSFYAKAVEDAGGVPVLLPPTEPYDESARAVMARVDGLIISGGADVNPERYGESPGAHTTVWHDHRDGWELALLTAADEADLPTLGICRGMQVMAVHAGGSLNQHVPDVVGHESHGPADDSFTPTHVTIEPGSRLHALVVQSQAEASKPHELVVQCHHHQSVAEHPGFRPVAWADDGLLEAMELPGDRLKLGVQWHPEMAADAGLFRSLVAAARDFTNS